MSTFSKKNNTKKSPYYSLTAKKMPKKQLLTNRENFWMLSVTRVIYTGCLFAGQTPTRKKKYNQTKGNNPTLTLTQRKYSHISNVFFLRTIPNLGPDPTASLRVQFAILTKQTNKLHHIRKCFQTCNFNKGMRKRPPRMKHIL